jgi:bifunctional non-homologous end joining protein LigD
MARRKQVVEQAPAPEFVPFQLVKLVSTPPAGDRWMHEIKFDGYRIQVRVEGGLARFHTRNGLDWTEKFPGLAVTAGGLPDCILDGELCAVNAEGYSDFSALRSALGARGRRDELAVFVFDILFEAGKDLRALPLTARKARLRAVLGQGGDQVEHVLRYVDESPFPPQELIAAACRMGLEGIVSKRRDAPYRSGKSQTWVKIKCRPGVEVVIGGWRTDGAKFRSLIAGVWEEGRLRYVGRIHTGYSDETIRELMPILLALEVDQSPFELGDVPRKTRDIHWLRPRLVADVEMAELTAGGNLRQASFKGLRADKTSDELRAESVG